MSEFPILTPETADGDTAEKLGVLRQVLGFVPNVAGVMANSSPLLSSFLGAFGTFRGAGTFTPAERQVLLLSNAVANGATWAVAFHSYEAVEDGVPAADVAALRRRELPVDARYAALSALTRALIEKRGHVDESDTKAFVAAGFEENQILEVVTGVAISAMTNYAANVAKPPLESVIRPHEWSADAPSGA
jgi:alkylhydroperoxidase family enzyme